MKDFVGEKVVVVWEEGKETKDKIAKVTSVSDDFITIEDDHGTIETINKRSLVKIKLRGDADRD